MSFTHKNISFLQIIKNWTTRSSWNHAVNRWHHWIPRMSTPAIRSSSNQRRNDIGTDCSSSGMAWVFSVCILFIFTQYSKFLVLPIYEGRNYFTGKDVISPEVDNNVSAGNNNDQYLDRSKQSSRANSFEIENLLKSAEQVTGFCRSPQETRKSSPTGSVASSVSNAMLTPSRQLTDAEKLRKVILELVDTEKSYVKVNFMKKIIKLFILWTFVCFFFQFTASP